MADEQEKSSATSAIILTVVIVLVAIYSTTFGMQTLQWFEGHHWAKTDPWLNAVPQAIPNSPAASAPAPQVAAGAAPAKGPKAAAPPKPTALTAYNYQFEVPWTAKFKQRSLPTGTEFRFDTGQVVVFNDPDAQLDTFALMRTTQSSQYALFQGMIDDGTIASNYTLYKAIYGTAPAQISPISNYNAASRNRVLLLTKLGFGPDLPGNLHAFDYGNNKGFQFGDPDKGPVAVRVFNSHDHQFRFIFTVFRGSGAQIAQADVDQAVKSLQTEPYDTK